jgi:hypothetical protein
MPSKPTDAASKGYVDSLTASALHVVDVPIKGAIEGVLHTQFELYGLNKVVVYIDSLSKQGTSLSSSISSVEDIVPKLFRPTVDKKFYVTCSENGVPMACGLVLTPTGKLEIYKGENGLFSDNVSICIFNSTLRYDL